MSKRFFPSLTIVPSVEVFVCERAAMCCQILIRKVRDQSVAGVRFRIQGEDLGAIGPSSSQPEWRSHHDSDRLRNYTTCQDVQIRLYIETK
ncbi:hypothetical protein RB195_010040 [Necator americanus]|uniref:Uncharacterized protein n=1 Tax=Necator americanus TaxID=51031 RepID=A0ABR1CWK3_NECAM